MTHKRMAGRNLRDWTGGVLAVAMLAAPLNAHAQARPGPGAASAAATAAGELTPPAPPGEPSPLVADTMYTTRLYGTDPAQEAVSVTRHTYPAAMPVSAPGETSRAPDRPWAVVLIDPNNEVAGISAAELIHFPDNAPVLFTGDAGLSAVTKAELTRLHPVGVQRDGGIQVFAVGAAASVAVVDAVRRMGFKVQTITGADPYALADAIDQAYGAVEDPDTGVPTMMTGAAGGGNGIMDVFIGAVQNPAMMLPAAEWASHMPVGILWVDGTKDTLPPATEAALKRRGGHADIYVMGTPKDVTPALFRALLPYGNTARVTNDDSIASNAPLPDDPAAQAVAFARMWDPVGLMGWNITGPGHGFILVNRSDWQGAVAAAVMSGIGFHAPLLLTDSATKLPAPVAAYLSIVRPNFLVTPAQGPYNMIYVLGDYGKISWPLQASVNASQEMANRHDAPNGSLYAAPQ
jgi:hypothetical protein